MIRGGFDRKLNSAQIRRYRDDWLTRVANKRELEHGALHVSAHRWTPLTSTECLIVPVGWRTSIRNGRRGGQSCVFQGCAHELNPHTRQREPQKPFEREHCAKKRLHSVIIHFQGPAGRVAPLLSILCTRSPNSSAVNSFPSRLAASFPCRSMTKVCRE